MKETAVEWLIKELTPSIALQQKYIDELEFKAKEIEKQQIIKAAYDNMNAIEENPMQDAIEYYNETFKSK